MRVELGTDNSADRAIADYWPAIVGSIAIAGSLTAISGLVSTDDVSMLAPNYDWTHTSELMLRNGRPVGWALGQLYTYFRIDPINSFQLFVPLLALAYGFFTLALGRTFAPLRASKGLLAMAAVAFAFSPSLIDLTIYKHAIDIIIVSFLALAFALPLLVAAPSLGRLGGLAGWSFLLALSYQPSASMLAWIAIWASLFALLPAQANSVWIELKSLAMRLAAIMAGAILAVIVLKSITYYLDVVALARADIAGVFPKITQHFRYVGQLFIFPQGAYQDRSPNIYNIFAFILCLVVISGTFRTKGSAFGLSILVLFLILISTLQNPQNLLGRTYWPSMRSSYYMGLFLPFCAIIVASAWRTFGVLAMVFVMQLNIASAVIVSSQAAELQRRDFLIAEKIAEEISRLDESRTVTKLAMPVPLWASSNNYGYGVDSPTLDWSLSKFDQDWSRARFLEYATGLKLRASNEKFDCQERPAAEKTYVSPVVTVVGNTAVVCF